MAEPALALGGLLLEDVAREGVPAAQLARAGLREALLRAGMGLHLRHGEDASMADPPCRAPARRRVAGLRRAAAREPGARYASGASSGAEASGCAPFEEGAGRTVEAPRGAAAASPLAAP